VGYDSKKKLGEKMTGGIIAAPIWLSYMQEALKDKPVAKFEPPKNFNVAKLDFMTGGSAVLKNRREPASMPTQPAGEKESSSSRGIEFLFGY
ncbi:MAG: hypothetical protein Q7S98_01305, partial [Deltaproteobacteria bacterium]|nr:hypothetical protein [Deltaproteobacteria bacterium]